MDITSFPASGFWVSVTATPHILPQAIPFVDKSESDGHHNGVMIFKINFRLHEVQNTSKQAKISRRFFRWK